MANNSTTERPQIFMDIQDGIATITINRPESRNALSVSVCNTLLDYWGQIDADAEIHVVILTSTDCGTFCAGMDLKEAAHLQATQGTDMLQHLRDPFHQRMRTVEKPIIAAMTGHFTAGGMVLAANSDIRIGLAGTSGGISEAKVGRGSPWAVPMLWMLPQPFLLELALTGSLHPISRFHEYGFINYVEPSPQAVRQRALDLARTIRENAPLTVWAAKKSINAAMDLGCMQGIEQARKYHERVYASQDAIEGPKAFAEKRKPHWIGA